MYRTSYTSWQSKYTFFLCRYRKQFCEQRQSFRTWSGILAASCTNVFYRKAAVTCQRVAALGTDALWYVSRWRMGAAPASAPSYPAERLLWDAEAFGFNHLDCSSVYLLSHYFPNGILSMWLLEVRWFSVWTVAIRTPKALFMCKKDIFNIGFLSFFNDKLRSVYSLSSRHKGAMMPCTSDDHK